MLSSQKQRGMSRVMIGIWVGVSWFACSQQADRGAATEGPQPTRVTIDSSDHPITHLTQEQAARFADGDALFEAMMREADGLGPLYVRASCSDCHRDDGRGPGRVTRLGVRAPIAEAARAKLLPYGDTVRPYVAAGARQALVAGSGPLIVTQRLPPAVFGRGYLEAVADEEIERLGREAAARSGPIRGRIARVRLIEPPAEGAGARAGQPSANARRIGRFGLKARLATLTEFTADAFHGDMGLTSPLFPVEPANPEHIEDDLKPGIDLGLAQVEEVADYVRLLALPRRSAPDPRAERLFAEALCATCHTPALRTRADYPIGALSDIDAPVYTDLLLHDMGEWLADGIAEGDASPCEWRTAPLMGLRFSRWLMHDGRADSVEAAIQAHAGPGSEANVSVRRFEALSAADRRALVEFVEGL